MSGPERMGKVGREAGSRLCSQLALTKSRGARAMVLQVCPWGPGREGACPRGLLVVTLQETGAPVNQQRALAACRGQEVERS